MIAHKYTLLFLQAGEPEPEEPPPNPGGGLATKTPAQLMLALAKVVQAMYEVHQVAQGGIAQSDDRIQQADAAVAAAITALAALQ